MRSQLIRINLRIVKWQGRKRQIRREPQNQPKKRKPLQRKAPRSKRKKDSCRWIFLTKGTIADFDHSVPFWQLIFMRHSVTKIQKKPARTGKFTGKILKNDYLFEMSVVKIRAGRNWIIHRERVKNTMEIVVLSKKYINTPFYRVIRVLIVMNPLRWLFTTRYCSSFNFR